MRLNRSTSHAIRILVECARAENDLVKVADLSDRLGITPQNVFKIVHLLSRAALVAAVRGRYGGVRLARPAADIRIGDVVRAMETTAFELDTDGGQRGDSAVSAGVNKVLDDALEAFVAILDRHSLADMTGSRKSAGIARGGTEPPKRRIKRPSVGARISVRGDARRRAQ
jgi:Rrf2 family protein